MGKRRPPAPPDPANTINAQTQSNLQTARTNAELNRYDQNTPWGSVDWSNQGNSWTQNTTLSPNQQQLLNQEEQNSLGLGQLASDQIGTISGILGQNYNPRRFDVNQATGGPLDLSQALGDFRGDTEARTRELMERGIGRYADRAREAQHSTLANQGINIGTEAWGDANRSLEGGIGDAYANAEVMARQQALGERGQHAGEVLTQRGRNLAEALQGFQLNDRADFLERETPLNEIIGLMSGSQIGYQPINPGQGYMTNMANTDVGGITQQGYQNQMGAWNAQQAQRNAFMGAVGQLGAAAITASDRRLKRDVEYAHTDDSGLRWWRYRYLWDDDGAPLRPGWASWPMRRPRTRWSRIPAATSWSITGLCKCNYRLRRLCRISATSAAWTLAARRSAWGATAAFRRCRPFPACRRRSQLKRKARPPRRASTASPKRWKTRSR
jgi:hypothetical protein